MKITAKLLIKFIWKLTAVTVLVIFFFTSLLYVNTTIYNFPETEIFSGNELYNPYEMLPDSSYRANFHAHSIAWEGVTNGHNTEKDLFDGYSQKGYDIVGISNYHNISKYTQEHSDLYIPVYEHGYNIFKSHYLSLNSDQVSYFDYPLFQMTSHKQKIIENLKSNNAIVCMAHPKFGGGRTFQDMQYLVNYEFTEVLNHYRISDEYWDEALSAGKLTWIMGNDDTHDIVNEPTFLIWNIIHSADRNSDSIMKSMVAGKNYAVKSYDGTCDNSLNYCIIKGNDSFTVQFENTVGTIEFIGDGGSIKKIDSNVRESSYTFKPQETYIRVVAKDEHSWIYLNPIVRYDGKNIPLNTNLKVASNLFKTWLFRITLILISFGLIILIRKTILR